jgi:hypothetical protein
MDAKLPWYQRWAVRLHLLYCVWCRRYAAQVRFLNRAGSHYGRQLDALTGERLSPEAKQRIQQELTDRFNKPPT